VAVKLHHILIFEKVLDDLFEDEAESFAVLGLKAFIVPLLLHLPAPSEVHRLPAHGASVVAAFEAPVFDAPPAHVVPADELGAAAVLEADRALHILTCFELYTESFFLAESLLDCLSLFIYPSPRESLGLQRAPFFSQTIVDGVHYTSRYNHSIV